MGIVSTCTRVYAFFADGGAISRALSLLDWSMFFLFPCVAIAMPIAMLESRSRLCRPMLYKFGLIAA